MRIMVFDVPAESGGALTILNQYHNEAIKDENNKWIFVVSTPKLKNFNNIEILNYPWIKKSWLHRLYFDTFIANKLVKKYDADEVLSLQNVIIPKVKVRQTLYLHQALPFIEKKYGLSENFKFWVYQNVISQIIFRSIKKADKVIIQSQWFMNAAIKKTGVNKEKFLLKKPELNTEVKKLYVENNNYKRLFFYPATGLSYKNHEIIVKASRLLKEKMIDNYEIIFTLKGNENTNIVKLRNQVETQNLPIKFIGSLQICEVYEYYSKSVLIFPSYIETFGLPLLEARMHHAPVIASKCAFSYEILDGYDKALFFDPFDASELEMCLKAHISTK